jgi:8-oxo-dGTP diphosphatase
MSTEPRLRVTARGLIIKDEKLLFVSDEGTYWYLPGGKIENSETLATCVEREIYEETGLVVKAGLLRHVLECFDIENHLHNIHLYFEASVLKGAISDNWNDEFGSVQFCKYFSLTEIQKHTTILPRFLAAGDWLHPSSKFHKIYEGAVNMRGFELVDA